MVHETPPLEQSEEVSHLVGRDGVAHTHVDAAAFLERRPAVDADDPALRIEQSATGIARVNRRIDLQAVGVFEDRARGKLVASHSRHDAGADRRLEVGGQQERVACGEAEVADFDVIAVGQFGVGKVVAAQELDERDVPCRIEAHEHRVVEPPVGKPALHRDARWLDDMKIGERVAVGTDEHARTAPGLSRKDRHRSSRRPPHDIDPLLLRVEHGRRHVPCASRQHGDGRPDDHENHERHEHFATRAHLATREHEADLHAGRLRSRDPSGCRWLIQRPLHEEPPSCYLVCCRLLLSSVRSPDR